MAKTSLERYHNEKDSQGVWRCPNFAQTLWEGRVFCFIGFNEKNSLCMRGLIERLLFDLIAHGGSFISEDHLYKAGALPSKEITFFVCNYAQGYTTRPYNAVDRKTATPLWLFFCHKDKRRYSPSYHPFFQPNDVFFCPSHPFLHLRVCTVGFRKRWLRVRDISDASFHSSENKARHCDDEEIIKRFITLAGAVIIPTKEFLLSLKGLGSHPTHVIASISSHISVLHTLFEAAKADIPVVGLEWLYNSYKHGRPLPEQQYLMQISDDGQIKLPPAVTSMKKNAGSYEEELRRTIFQRSLLYLSEYAAAMNPQLLIQCEEMGATRNKNLHVVHPTSILSSHLTMPNRHPTNPPVFIDSKNFLSLEQQPSNILIIDENEWKTGIFDDLAIQLELFLPNDSMQDILQTDTTNTSTPLKRNRFNDIAIALPKWITLCWRRCSWMPLSTDTGGIQIPNFLQRGYLESFDDKSDSITRREGKRRKGYTLHDLANSVIYGDDKADAHMKEEQQRSYSSRLKRSEEYRSLVASSNLRKVEGVYGKG